MKWTKAGEAPACAAELLACVCLYHGAYIEGFFHGGKDVNGAGFWHGFTLLVPDFFVVGKAFARHYQSESHL